MRTMYRSRSVRTPWTSAATRSLPSAIASITSSVSSDAHLDRIDPTGAVVLVAHDDLTVDERPAIRELQAVAAVDPDRVRADELELSVDVEARLFDQFAPGRVLRELTRLDRTSGEEPLPRERTAGALQQEDLTVTLGVYDRGQGVERRLEVGRRVAEWPVVT